jgi:hypothetical protein
VSKNGVGNVGMKTPWRTFTVLMALATCSIGSNAKVFDAQHLPKNTQQLQNADSFSVECRDQRTGVVDRESVDIDAATVTVEIPGSAPVVHPIIRFAVGGYTTQDRFGQPAEEMHLVMANWGRIGNSDGVGLNGVGLWWSGERFASRHEDNSLWLCAN